MNLPTCFLCSSLTLSMLTVLVPLSDSTLRDAIENQIALSAGRRTTCPAAGTYLSSAIWSDSETAAVALCSDVTHLTSSSRIVTTRQGGTLDAGLPWVQRAMPSALSHTTDCLPSSGV